MNRGIHSVPHPIARLPVVFAPIRRRHICPAPSPGPPSTILRIDVLGWLKVGPGWSQKANLVEPPDQGQVPRKATRPHGRVLKHKHHRRPGSLGGVDRETMEPWDSWDRSWNTQRGNTERAAAGPTQSSISSRRDSPTLYGAVELHWSVDPGWPRVSCADPCRSDRGSG